MKLRYYIWYMYHSGKWIQSGSPDGYDHFPDACEEASHHKRGGVPYTILVARPLTK